MHGGGGWRFVGGRWGSCPLVDAVLVVTRSTAAQRDTRAIKQLGFAASEGDANAAKNMSKPFLNVTLGIRPDHLAMRSRQQPYLSS